MRISQPYKSVQNVDCHPGLGRITPVRALGLPGNSWADRGRLRKPNEMEGPLTVHVTAAEFREDVKGAPFRTRLTQRELSVLKIASDGRTADEIADVLGLGMETVRSHLKKARTKLGARNSAHAVAEAMRQLLIA